MKNRCSLVLAALLLASSLPALAGDPVTIPPATYEAMKKGKKLNLVWRAPDFDGSQGFRLGKLSNESEDEASAVLQDFPIVLKRQMVAGSPYTLHLAVTGVRTAEKSGGLSSARVDVEGRVVDSGGKLVAAFETRATATIGGNKRDNIRYATTDIAFGLAKDLFSVGLPSTAKAPAVIVAAPSDSAKAPAVAPAEKKPSAVFVPAPAPVPPAQPALIVNAAPAAVTPSPAAPLAQAPKPAPQPPVVMPKPLVAETLPAAISGNMKRGKALDRLWISPAYDRAGGFSIGEVRYLIEQRDDTVAAYLPDGLGELAKPDASCALHLGITGLTSRAMVGRMAMLRIRVEGRLIARDGTILAAFATGESLQSSDDINASYRELARKVVLAIGKDLR